MCGSCGGRVAWRKTAPVCVGSCGRTQGAARQLEVHLHMQTLDEPMIGRIAQIRAILGLAENASLIEAIDSLQQAANRRRATRRSTA